MCLLLETIRIEHGRLQNLELHNRRFNCSRKELFGIDAELDLAGIITVPNEAATGIFKCRLEYSQEILLVEIIPYVPKQVCSIKLINVDDLIYKYKYADRSRFDMLLKNSSADEILIVQNGFLTDTSFSNIAFSDGTVWFTPTHYLLNGTMRQKLLQEGFLTEAALRPQDIHKFHHAMLINAMLGPENSPILNCNSIFSI